MSSMGGISSEKIFDSACAFAVTEELILHEIRSDPSDWLAVSLAVNGAFSVELSLKCLLFLETGAIIKGHDLLQLYQALTRANRDKVAQHYDRLLKRSCLSRIAPPPGMTALKLDIQTVLATNGSAFERFRYLFEAMGDGQSGYWGIDVVGHAVRQVILELQ